MIIPKDAAAVRSSLTILSNTDTRYSLFNLAAMLGVGGVTASWGDGFGFDIGGTPVGDDRYAHYAMDKVRHEAMADTSHVTALLGTTSAHAAFAILRQSSVTRLNYVSMSVRPTISTCYLKLFDGLIENDFNLLSGTSTSGLEPTEKSLVLSRLRAPQRLGGVELGSLGSNSLQHFVNGFTMAVPRITSRTVDSKWIIGCIPALSSVLGSAFSDGRADGRFRKAASADSIEKSPTCRSFYVAYRQLQRSVSGAESTVPATGVLAVPVEVAGIKEGRHDGGVLPKLASLIAEQRASVMKAETAALCELLPRTSKVREAYVYARTSPPASAFLATCPTTSHILANVHFQSAMASYLGLPLPVLHRHVGIQLPHSASLPLRLDPHGNAISKADSIQGSHTKQRHDRILVAIGDMLATAD